MSPRQRQVKQSRNEDSSSKVKSSKSQRQQDSSKSKYLIIISLAILALTYSNVGGQLIDKLATSLHLHTPTHVIVIDAGSTASRVNVFSFHNSLINGQLILDDTLFHETKPGLSSYAKNIQGVEKSLNILLDKAKSRIVSSRWASTPLSLRATAGLRLLPDNLAQSILDECKRVLASSGFKVDDHSIDIMDGADEGIFSWFTTNFVLDKFGSEDETVAAFDLGGGSNQITFSVNPEAIKPQSPHAKNIHHLNVFNRNISLFTESFLGMGLMAARKEILTHDQPKIKGIKEIEISTPCLGSSSETLEWSYAGKNYILKGLNVDAPTKFHKCLDIIKKVVNSAIPHDLPSLRGHQIYAFSYYFERAEEAGLIEPITGGIVSVGSILDFAKKFCSNPKIDQSFMCLDLSFIYVLLHDGFALDDSSKISMRKYINGHQLNWALGAAFNILQTQA